MWTRWTAGGVLLWALCVAQGMECDSATCRAEEQGYVSVRDHIARTLHSMGDHYVDTIRGILVKLNNKLIPLYKEILNKFNTPLRSIRSVYRRAIDISKSTISRAITQCQTLEYYYFARQTKKVEHLILQCVTQGTKNYLLLAKASTDKIHTKADILISEALQNLEECQRDTHQVHLVQCLSDRAQDGKDYVLRLREIAQEQVAIVTAEATHVSNKAYACFSKKIVEVAHEVTKLRERSRKCAQELSQLLFTEPRAERQGLETPPTHQRSEEQEPLHSDHDVVSEEYEESLSVEEEYEDILSAEDDHEEVLSAEGDL